MDHILGLVAFNYITFRKLTKKKTFNVTTPLGVESNITNSKEVENKLNV